MASDSNGKKLEDLIRAFEEWADGPAGIVRSKEIKIKVASDENFGLIGVLDLSSHRSAEDADLESQPKAKRSVRPPIVPFLHIECPFETLCMLTASFAVFSGACSRDSCNCA